MCEDETDLLNNYFERAHAIIGERTKAEEAYDNEIVACLRKYGKIRRAVNRANKKYPDEALKYTDENIGELKERYEYLLEHENIVNKISH